MSIHCIKMPPNMLPRALVSPGKTTFTVSTREARGVDGGTGGEPGREPVASITGSGSTAASVGQTTVYTAASTMRHHQAPLLSTGLLFLVVFLALLGLSPPAAARVYTLPELLELVRKSNPGLAAGARATARVEAQLAEANWSWLPSGEMLSVLAPVPEIRCEPDLVNCISTSIKDINDVSETLKFRGIFTRTEFRLVQPLFTFGKLSAGRQAAREGLSASRKREAGVADELALNVKRAYYGLKLARAVLETLSEGQGRLQEAQTQMDKDLAEGTGNVTQTDKLRLRTVRAELEIRVLEAEKGADEARSGLRALIGAETPTDIEVDSEPLEPVNVPERPLAHYEEQARLSRPELRALDHLVASKRALADLERRKLYPDLVLLGSATLAYASSIDDPQNAFFNDPFNSRGAGVAAALRLPLDLGVRNARAAQLRADAEETVYRRREAMGGVAFEVERAHASLREATKRLAAVRQGERAAKAWITAVGANFATGLAEAKDFADALVASFQFRIRALQAIFDLNMAAASLARATGAEVAVAPAPKADSDSEK
jgi:outer membrane protein, multidrug efflux system